MSEMNIYAESMYALGAAPSVIRELFEYGKKMKSELGENKVFDFSLGNPSVSAPDIVKESIIELCNNTDGALLHGYTSAVGDTGAREAIASYLNEKYSTGFSASDIYMTCGAAASLTISLNALYSEGDEAIFFAPFFPEYTVFATKAGYKTVNVCCDENLQIDVSALEKAINEHTKLIIINSPNNPTGVVTGAEKIKEIAALLKRKSEEYGRPIFIICDEPYRELVYDDIEVPYITNYYDNTLVCYSFSKSLSLPGERIGYIIVSPKCDHAKEIYLSVCGAGRSLGFVCAPSIFQYIIPKCIGHTADVSVYKNNRDALLKIFDECGFEAVRPDGAFYLFLKAKQGTATEFAEKAKKYQLLIVPSDSFGYPGYVRVASCVAPEMIERSKAAWLEFSKEYK